MVWIFEDKTLLSFCYSEVLYVKLEKGLHSNIIWLLQLWRGTSLVIHVRVQPTLKFQLIHLNLFSILKHVVRL